MDLLDEKKLQDAALAIENQVVKDFTTQVIPVVTAAANGVITAVFGNADKLVDKVTASGVTLTNVMVGTLFSRLDNFRDMTFDRARLFLSDINITVTKSGQR